MSQDTASPNDFSMTLARGLQVLEIFATPDALFSTSEIAARVGLSRAAARRFLLTLVKLGYLDHTRGSFFRTRKLETLAGSLSSSEERWSRATPIVLDLANRADESVSISVLDAADIKFVVRDPKRRMFSARLAVGDRLPAHCSAAGKVLLASLDPRRLDELLSSPTTLQPRTAFSITEPAALRLELKRVRLRSWASAEDEMEIGTIAIAVPIFDAGNGVIGALAVASHKMRRTIGELHDQFLPMMIDTAERISTVVEMKVKT